MTLKKQKNHIDKKKIVDELWINIRMLCDLAGAVEDMPEYNELVVTNSDLEKLHNINIFLEKNRTPHKNQELMSVDFRLIFWLYGPLKTVFEIKKGELTYDYQTRVNYIERILFYGTCPKDYKKMAKILAIKPTEISKMCEEDINYSNDYALKALSLWFGVHSDTIGDYLNRLKKEKFSLFETLKTRKRVGIINQKRFLNFVNARIPSSDSY